VIEAWAADHPRPAADEFGAVDTLDTLGHVLAAAGEADRAAAAFAEAVRLGGLEREAMHRAGLRRLGLEAGPGSQALKAALARCAAQGAACRIAPE
jgi:cytochrome c-type biogenesis protein CcmH/NrfG